MIICLCVGVSESEVKDCIEKGAISLELIEESCGAGSCCQSCHPELLSLLYEKNFTDHRLVERSSNS